MLRYARMKASCDRSNASSLLPTRPSAIKYASFIYLLTIASKAAFEPLWQRCNNAVSSSQKLSNLFGSGTGRYDSNAGFILSFHINIYIVKSRFIQSSLYFQPALNQSGSGPVGMKDAFLVDSIYIIALKISSFEWCAHWCLPDFDLAGDGGFGCFADGQSSVVCP